MAERITLATADAYIAKMKAEFALKYRYMVAGQTDLPFQDVGKAISDEFTFDTLKRARVQEKIALRTIANSGDAQHIQDKRSGEAKLVFIRSSIRALKAIAAKGDPEAIARGIAALSSELKGAVARYGAGQGVSADEARDARFAVNAKKLMDDLNGMIPGMKPRLLGVRVYFSADLNNAGKHLAAVKLSLAALSAPAEASASSASSSDVDIVV